MTAHGCSRALLQAAVLWLLAAVAAHAQDWLTVATYNLQNYTVADRRLTDGNYRPDYPKPETEKTALRHVIAALNADVIALQEIGGPGFLNELRRDLRAEGIDYPHGTAPLGPDPERGLGVLSRRPLGRVILHDDLVGRPRGPGTEPAPVRRGLLEIEIPTPNGPVTLFVVHLKSRLTELRDDPASEDQRVAEAQAVRDRVLRIFPDPAQARFLIVGDFNDTPGSRALNAIIARGRTPVATWLDAADARGQRWTHVYDRVAVYARFDHILVSEGLRRGDDARASARILDEPWADIRTASDHRPVIARVRLDP